MAEPIRVVVLSTSRSDLGFAAPVWRGLRADPRFATGPLVLAGQHLRAGTGDEPGIAAERLDVPAGSLGCIHQEALAARLDRRAGRPPPILFVVGDRVELLEACLAATHAGAAIAHSAGGERTLGAVDDQVRDAVTKLAHLHYPCHAPARDRLLALQEESWRIRVAGEPGLDDILAEDPAADPAAAPGDVVVALHPVTRDPGETMRLVEAIAAFAAGFPGRLHLSTPNGDSGSAAIAAAWSALAAGGRHRLLPSLGAAGFRRLVRACGLIIGNSSAGLIEAPSLGAATVDLGSRQRGRVRGSSVITLDPCAPADLPAAVAAARALPPAANPYGDGHAVARIRDHLAACAGRADLLTKA